MQSIKSAKQKEQEEGEKKNSERNANEGGRDICCCLAQSHIDLLHSTELLGYYSYTGLDNFTASTHIRTHLISNFASAPCSQP